MGLLGDALIEAPNGTKIEGPAQRQRDQCVAGFGTHRREVAEVDRDQPPAKATKVETWPRQAEVGLLDHGVGGRHHQWITAPNRGVVVRRGNEQPTGRRIEVALDRAQHSTLAKVRKPSRPACDALGYTGTPSTGLLATAFTPM